MKQIFRKSILGICVLTAHLALNSSVFAAAGASSNGSVSYEPVGELERFCKDEIIAHREARKALDRAVYADRHCRRTQGSINCDMASVIEAELALKRARQKLEECIAYFYWLEEN